MELRGLGLSSHGKRRLADHCLICIDPFAPLDDESVREHMFERACMGNLLMQNHEGKLHKEIEGIVRSCMDAEPTERPKPIFLAGKLFVFGTHLKEDGLAKWPGSQ